MLKKLSELLELVGNRVTNNVLTIKEIHESEKTGGITAYAIDDNQIKSIIVDVRETYLVLDARNKTGNSVTSIELKQNNAVLAVKNISPECIIAINGTAKISLLKTIDGRQIEASIRLGEEEAAKEE